MRTRPVRLSGIDQSGVDGADEPFTPTTGFTNRDAKNDPIPSAIAGLRRTFLVSTIRPAPAPYHLPALLPVVPHHGK